MKRVDNLHAILDIETQVFIKNLVEGVKDPKMQKKFTKDEHAAFKEEAVEMITLALKALYTFGLGEIE